MAEQQTTTDQQTTTTGSDQPATVEMSVLDTSSQPVVDKDQSVLDAAGAEEKAAQEAERQRLIDADPETLNDEDKAKRDGFIKENEEAKKKALAEERAKGVPEKYEFTRGRKVREGYSDL